MDGFFHVSQPLDPGGSAQHRSSAKGWICTCHALCQGMDLLFDALPRDEPADPICSAGMVLKDGSSFPMCLAKGWICPCAGVGSRDTPLQRRTLPE